MTTSAPIDSQRLFEALDVLEKQRSIAQAKNESLMSSEAREADMVSRLRKLQEAQGLPVDEEAIAAAVRATREPSELIYQATPDNASVKLAQLYMRRAKWLPQACIGLALFGVIGGASGLVAHVRAERFDEQVTQIKRDVVFKVNQEKVLAAYLPKWNAGLGQQVHKEAFANALNQAHAAQTQAATLMRGEVSRENADAAQARLELASKALAAANTAQVNSAQQSELDAAEIELSQGARAIKGWPEVEASRQARLRDLHADLVAGNLADANKQILTIGTLEHAIDMRNTLRAAVVLVPAAGAAEAEALRVKGEAALLNGDADGAQQSIGALRSLTNVIATSYTLKIVNEQGVKSGFWRQPDGNNDAYNYYVVVDALDASGNPVSIPVVNEEDGQHETVSRFAHRVSKDVFDAVKADKQDNGLIDKPIVGTKRAGALAAEYSVDTAGGGVITHW
jgi:hypothetical protein